MRGVRNQLSGVAPGQLHRRPERRPLPQCGGLHSVLTGRAGKGHGAPGDDCRLRNRIGEHLRGARNPPEPGWGRCTPPHRVLCRHLSLVFRGVRSGRRLRRGLAPLGSDFGPRAAPLSSSQRFQDTFCILSRPPRADWRGFAGTGAVPPDHDRSPLSQRHQNFGNAERGRRGHRRPKNVAAAAPLCQRAIALTGPFDPPILRRMRTLLCTIASLALLVSPAQSQVAYYGRLGLTASTKLIRDAVVQEIDVQPGLAPTIALGASVPFAPTYRAGLEASLTSSGFHSSELGVETDLGTLRTGSLLLNLEGPLAPRLSWRGGFGVIRYWPADQEGIFLRGGTSRF